MKLVRRVLAGLRLALLRLSVVLTAGVVLTSCRTPPTVSPTPAEEVSAPEAEALTKAAWASFGAGDSTRALDGLERAVALYATAGREDKELDTRIQAAVVVSEAGAPERAVERLRKILERLNRLDLPEIEGLAWVHIARAQTRIGDFSAAHTALDQALVSYLKGRSEEGRALAAGGRAYTLMTEGRMEEAITAGEEATLRSERLGLDEEAIRSRAVVAYAFQQTGNDDRVYELYLMLREQAWQNNNQRMLQFVYCNLAEIDWRRGRARPAEEELRATIDSIEAERAASPTMPEERAVFLSQQVPAYDRLIRLLADTYRGNEGFAIAERFHALSLLESLQARDLDSAAFERPGLRSRERRLLAELGAMRLAFDDLESESARARERGVLRSREAELAALRIELRMQNPRYANLVAPEPPGAEQVQAGLEPGEVLIAYWVSEERLIAWALTPDRVHFVEMPLPRHRLAATIARYLSPLRSPQRAEDTALKGEEAEHIVAGRELYDWLIAPIRAVAEAESLIIVPDDLLHHLPFESLVASCEPRRLGDVDRILYADYRDCQFLGTQKAIAYNPSAGVFLELRQRAGAAAATTSMLAMAPTFSGDRQETLAAAFTVRGALPRRPLIHAADEVARVARIFSSGTGDVGHRASEARFKAEAGRHQYLHLATHGLVDDAMPMVSGLLLEPGDGEDGLLQGHEVLGLELSSKLVTLSACRSGRGELSRGEGIVGLARAFLYAGASSVLVSQWDVDDRSTPDLMAGFYRRLADGTTRAEALRAARADLFERTGETRVAFRQRPVAYAHPRYWSAFKLIGAP